MKKLLTIFILAIALSCSTAFSATLGTVKTDIQMQQGNPRAVVWVNTASGVYHCPGSRWYGNTQRGEYMSQAQALENGYRPAYGTYCDLSTVMTNHPNYLKPPSSTSEKAERNSQ